MIGGATAVTTPGSTFERDGGRQQRAGKSDLYAEVPVIEIEGNLIRRDNPATPNDIPYFEPRSFNPKTPQGSELYDADQDGVDDTYINDFASLGNAANRLVDIELAACVAKPPMKHLGYADPLVWMEPWIKVPGVDRYRYQWPDTLPASADEQGTRGTQFVQLILPFEIDGSSLFDKTQPNPHLVDYLNPAFLTISDESGSHVYCTVLVNGVDVDGNGPALYTGDPEWPQLAGVNIAPGPGKSSIVFMAQPSPGVLGDVPDRTPFSLWAAREEIHIRLKQVRDAQGNLVPMDSRWFVLKEGGTPSAPEVTGIEATEPVLDGNGQVIMDPLGNLPLVSRASSFLIRFSKPVIPETVGDSIVFSAPPFNGNTKPVVSSLTWNPPPPGQNPCADNGTYFDPIAPNVAVMARLLHPDGTPAPTRAVVPFRCHPLHQNNLCTYVVNPVLDLPASSELGSPPFQDPSVVEITRLRITVKVYYHDQNDLSGLTSPPYLPVNLGPCGFFKETMKEENFEATFTASSEGRYVNAPVCPHALYYTMGPGGLGVADLDGNGFTTNDPDFAWPALVTSQRFYDRFGNAGKGMGNNYSYGAKATGGPPYIGLGDNSAMPGVNEGSTGIDEVVRDSKGRARLFPDPEGGSPFCNITDVEVGDFLDTIFYDASNPWAEKSYHISPINLSISHSFENNLIGTPPTPNPPPLTLPIGMGVTHVLLDDVGLSEEGAFVITGKEIFTVDLPGLGVPIPAQDTGFIHLLPAQLAGSPVDEAFPPIRSTWPAASGGYSLPDYMNLGPVAESATLGTGYWYGSRQQIGNFLFAADKANDAVRVLNAGSMEVITSLTGLHQPDSLAVTPDLRRLYVSNSGAGTVSVFDVDPRADRFLQCTAEIGVGNMPKGICCQPDYEDVFVCNFGSSSISIIDPQSNTVRKTLRAHLDQPWDLVCGPRQDAGLGFMTGVFHGYISNFGGDNVLVYESGPDGIGGIGYDDILGAARVGPQFLPIQSPRGLCWDPLPNGSQFLAGGCFVAHASGTKAVVSRIQFTTQKGPMGPIFIFPHSAPKFLRRIFRVTAQWGGIQNPLSGAVATDVALLDYNREAWLDENWLSSFYVTNLGDFGENPHLHLPVNNKHPLRFLNYAFQPTWKPDRLYVSFLNTPVVDVIDPSDVPVVKTITGLPAPAKVLKTYFKF